MLDENESQGRLGRRAVAVGVGAMLMGGTQLVGCPAGAATAGNEKKPASNAFPIAPADLPYATER